MIPEKVRFTGLTVPTGRLLFKHNKRKIASPYPGNWLRVEVDNSPEDAGAGERLDAWLEDNISGRWGYYRTPYQNRSVIMFEQDTDALLFKLMDAETIWKDTTSNN